jgi:hypothetical protein
MVIIKMGHDASFGISDSLEYYELELDSLDATQSVNNNTSSTDWPLYYFGRPLQNVAAIKILEAEIPFSFYVFNNTNNVFTVTVVPSSGPTVSGPVVISPGNYTADTLATYLTAQLNGIYSGGTFTVTYAGSSAAPNTGKFTFNLAMSPLTTVTDWVMTFNGTSNSNPSLFLGFNSQSYSSTYVSGTGNVIQAPNAALVTGPNYLYVNSRQIGQLANLFLPTGAVNLGNGNLGPQLSKIPVNVQPNGTIFWQDPDPGKWFDLEDLANISSLDLFLTLGNFSQTPLPLNGLGFSVKIGVLINKVVSTSLLGGHVGNNRVFKRFRV